MGGLTFNIGSLGMFADMMASGIARNNATGQTGIFGEIAQKLSGTGILEINIGSNGIKGKFGTGGFDLAGSLYTFGKRMNDKAALEAYAMQECVSEKEAEAAYWGYVYGDWTQENTIARIANDVDQLNIVKSMANGGTAQTVQKTDGIGRVITMKDTGDKHQNAVQLGHEAYRNGVVGNKAEQQSETFNAVVGHAAMAARMDEYGTHFDGLLGAEVGAYQRGDMAALMLDSMYNYDSSADYWKLVQRDDGSFGVQFDYNHSLVDENGNILIKNEMDEFDEKENIIGHKKGMSYSASLGMLLGTYTDYFEAVEGFTTNRKEDYAYAGKNTESYMETQGFKWMDGTWINTFDPNASIAVNGFTMTLIDLKSSLGISLKDGFVNFNLRDEKNNVIGKAGVPYGDNLDRYIALENMVPQGDLLKAGMFKIDREGTVSMYGVSSTLPTSSEFSENYPAIADGTYAFKFDKHYPNEGVAYDALRLFNSDYQNEIIKLCDVTGANINNLNYRNNVPGFYFGTENKIQEKYTSQINYHLTNKGSFMYDKKRTGSLGCLTTYPSQYWSVLPSTKTTNRSIDGYMYINRTLYGYY